MKIIKYIFVKQDDLKDCGISSLLMIIKTYKGNCSKEYLRWLTNTDGNGVTAYDLVEAAKLFNFNSYGIKCNLEDIDNKQLPIIAHVILNNQYKHFIVIYKIDFNKKKILIADPSDKIKQITFEEFKSISSNSYIYMKPVKKILTIKSKNSLFMIINNCIKMNIKIIIFVLFIGIFVSILTCINSYIFKFIIDDYKLIVSNNSYILLLIVFVFILYFIKSLFNFIKYILLININNKLDFSVFKNVYNKIISLPYIYFKNRSTGEIMTRINDLEIIKNLFASFISTIILDLILIFICSLFLLLIDIKLIFILLFIILLIIFIFNLLKNKIKTNLYFLKNNHEKVNSLFYNSINNIESIRNLNLNYIFNNKFDYLYKKYINSYNKYNNILFLNEFLFDFLENIILIFSIIIGLYLVRCEYIKITNLLVIFSLLNLITNSFYDIINFLYEYINGLTSINRIKELCDIDFNEKDGIFINEKINNIKIKNLSYSYSYKDKCLNNININISNNKKVLLTGKSGTGKSTLTKIILGYLKNNGGEIFINDYNFSDVNVLSLRNKITLVSQNENLFPTSFKENIIMGRDIDESKFKEVCSIFEIDEMLLKNNLTYDFEIDENGFNLSGGQKQRIILARSLLKSADVYIFDESFSNLDYKLERKILIKLFEYLKDKIIIIISHRFNNNDLFDKIIEI